MLGDTQSWAQNGWLCLVFKICVFDVSGCSAFLCVHHVQAVAAEAREGDGVTGTAVIDG